MITRGIIASLFLIFATVLTFSACDVTSEKGLDESLDKVPDVTLIKGAENASIRVNSGTTSNFLIDIDNVEWNTLISNGEREAYCIAPEDPISSDNSIYDGIGVYSTENDEQFKDVNRLFSMKNALQKADPEITWREIQVAIWSLVPFQEFDMNMPVDELPSEVRSNGEINFDKDKVQFILDVVQNRNTAKTAEFSDLMNNSSSSSTTCVIGTDEITQSLITECDESSYAYGGNEELNDDDQAGFISSGDPNDLPASCFPKEEVSSNKWGWTNGGLAPGYDNSQDTWPIYSGAGKCILSKGHIVGQLTVKYSDDGAKADVTFDLYPSEFDIEDGQDFTQLLHLYVGHTSVPPSGNFAPGGFYDENDPDYYSQSIINQDDENLTVTYEVTGLKSTGIWVIAHIGE